MLSVGPYYNKPTPEGFFRHFSAIADASPVPVVFYNVPGRTGSNIDAPTQRRLAAHPNIAGVKEASGNLGQMMEILRDRPAGFEVLSGDDAFTLAMMAHGAEGVISVAANQIPGPMHDLVAAAARGDFAEALRIHNRFLDLMNLNFVESNPIPVKASLALLGLCEESFRLPLCPPKDSTREALRDDAPRARRVVVSDLEALGRAALGVPFASRRGPGRRRAGRVRDASRRASRRGRFAPPSRAPRAGSSTAG